MLDFRIETFLCVCNYMNYTKAAKALGITQPGVSQHIKYLENYYGDTLFSYSNKVYFLSILYSFSNPLPHSHQMEF